MREPPAPDSHGSTQLAALTLTALGIVYGDIGTSPLYAFRECFNPAIGLTPTPDHVLGVLSLILWAILAVVSVKYVGFILKADNRGEGGIFALLALLRGSEPPSAARRLRIIVAIGLVGAALLYGDGIITPAISVLGAIEGLATAAPALERAPVILSIAVLVALFAVQRFGTAKVGGVFGPVMLAWFFVIAVLGARAIASHPDVLAGVNPWLGIALLLDEPARGGALLGAVVLAVTGAEALYADMGHVGRRPIRIAWFGVVLPALLVNYFGQGALVLADPTAAGRNPFYELAPRWGLYPLTLLATLAAVVASQALISGAFSLTRQCIQLGYAPRMTIVHTSRVEEGQIYIPEVNAALAIGAVWMVLAFGSSSAISGAYGIAVTGTMAITTLLFHRLLLDRWQWRPAAAWSLTSAFLLVDLAFLSANLGKVDDGGWVPLLIAVVLALLMTTWQTGRSALTSLMRARALPMALFLDDLARGRLPRVPGTAVFLTSQRDDVPLVVLHHLKHTQALHRQVVLLSVVTADVPDVRADDGRLSVSDLGQGVWRVIARVGFAESPDVPGILQACAAFGLETKPLDTTYILGRDRLVPTGRTAMPRLEKLVFAFLARNAQPASAFFGLPPNRVVELGALVEL